MKNKKSIAMAMAAVSTMGAVAPAFADEIVGKVNPIINLGHINGEKSQWLKDENGKIIREEIVKDASITEKQRIQAEKDLEKTVERINELASEKDSNGNLKYELKTDYINAIIGTNEADSYFGYLQVTLADKTDMDKDHNPKVKYTFKFTTYKADFGFGQELPWNTENKIRFDFTTNTVYTFDENNVSKIIVNKNEKEAYAKLSKVIYELNKATDKITAKEEGIEGTNGVTIFAGKIGQDKTEDDTRLARIELVGTVNKSKVKFVNASNDFLGHWAEDTIVDAMIAGIVDNTAKFNPEQEITRAQFAKMVCEANNIKPIEYNQANKDKFEKFTDVPVTEWYAGYVAAIFADSRQLMKGDGDGTFRPEDKISRQEVAVVLAKLHNKGVDVEQVTTDVNGNRVHKDTKTNFVDDAKIDVWADESVEYLREKGIAKGYALSDGKFEYRPVNNMSRAEALTMITRVSKSK